jgi:hypothetical protein
MAEKLVGKKVAVKVEQMAENLVEKMVEKKDYWMVVWKACLKVVWWVVN